MSQGLTPGVLGAPEPRMYPRSRYFLVLTKMSEAKLDNFNIIVFESNITQWKPFGNKELSYSIPRNNGDVGQAYDYILKLKAGGSTNIDQTLTEAINLAYTYSKKK